MMDLDKNFHVIITAHDHGTSEQFHSELKSDMGIELLPSGNLKKNALVLRLATVAFNYLRIIGQAALQSVKSPVDAKSCQLRYRLHSALLDFTRSVARPSAMPTR